MDTTVTPATGTSPAAAPASRANPALWAMIGIPAATVVASAITLAMAYGGAEPQLPARYAWEGAALDHDLARADRARDLVLAADLELLADGRIVVRLTHGAPAASGGAAAHARALTLHLTHATRPALDRSVALVPIGPPDRFEGRLETLPPARWLVQLDDEVGGWRLRGRLETPDATLRLGYPAQDDARP